MHILNYMHYASIAQNQILTYYQGRKGLSVDFKAQVLTDERDI